MQLCFIQVFCCSLVIASTQGYKHRMITLCLYSLSNNLSGYHVCDCDVHLNSVKLLEIKIKVIRSIFLQITITQEQKISIT